MNWFLGLNAAKDGRPRQVQVIAAPGTFSVDITLSFDVGPDEFSLDASEDAPSLLVQMNGDEILRRSDTILAVDSPVVVDDVKGLVVGTNEFYVQASPRDQGSFTANCMRLRILRDGLDVAEKTLWSAPGESLQGVIQLEVVEE